MREKYLKKRPIPWILWSFISRVNIKAENIRLRGEYEEAHPVFWRCHFPRGISSPECTGARASCMYFTSPSLSQREARARRILESLGCVWFAKRRFPFAVPALDDRAKCRSFVSSDGPISNTSKCYTTPPCYSYMLHLQYDRRGSE